MGRHFQADIILICTRWYLRYSLSYRDIEEMMTERGLSVDHTTIYRWVQRYAPELDKRSRSHLKQTNDSWRVDETYVKVKGQWMYLLYRAVDKNPTCIGAIRDLKQDKLLPKKCKRRPSQYMNNMVEQDHQFMKRKIKPGLGFFSYPTAWRTIQGYETMHMIRKGQIVGVGKGNVQAQNQFIARLFGLAV